jgi:hypothetical protein
MDPKLATSVASLHNINFKKVYYFKKPVWIRSGPCDP